MPPSQTTARAMTPTEWGLLVTLSAIWGGSFFFNGVLVKALPTLTIVVGRVALAAAILWLVVAALRVRVPMDRAAWAAFFGMGLLNNAIPFSLIVWGQSHIASGVASILNATTPVFGVIVAHLLTPDEKMTGNRLFGVVCGFLGVAVMIGGSALSSLGDEILAELACLAAAVSYAFSGVFGRRFHRMGIAPLATATGQMTASTLILLPFVLWIDRPWTLAPPGIEVIGAMVGLAAVCTALAYLMFFRILATAGATNVMLVTLLVPVSAVLLGVVFLGEHLAPKHVAGMAMIALGLAAIDGRAWRAVRRMA